MKELEKVGRQLIQVNNQLYHLETEYFKHIEEMDLNRIRQLAKEALIDLKAYRERLESGELVQQMAYDIYNVEPHITGDNEGSTVALEFNELSQTDWEYYTKLAQAAINIIKGK